MTSKNEKNTETTTPPPSREEILEVLAWAVRYLKKKVDVGRYRDPAVERYRDNKMRLLIYACSTLGTIQRDHILEDLAARVAVLEESKKGERE